MPCNCAVCSRYTELQERLLLIPTEHRDFVFALYDDLVNAQNDLSHANAIIKGTWPQADEIIAYVRSQQPVKDTL